MGIAANYIQANSITSHTIVENHPQIIEKAKVWADEKSNVTIVEGDWYAVKDSLSTYDGIFYVIIFFFFQMICHQSKRQSLLLVLVVKDSPETKKEAGNPFTNALNAGRLTRASNLAQKATAGNAPGMNLIVLYRFVGS